MRNKITIGLIGDHDQTVPAHRAIPLALQAAGKLLGKMLSFQWVPTEAITAPSRLAAFDGLWCVPASPYRSMDGALLAIRHARENRLPFLGTCGGFQHAIIEYARNVLGWSDAEHAETTPQAARAVISPLECALVGSSGWVQFTPGSRMASAYQSDNALEEYQCRYGVNADYQSELLAGPLRATAMDESGAVRAVELEDHPFFVATLFQPERVALKGRECALAVALVHACAA